jgi:hypothetical protein
MLKVGDRVVCQSNVYSRFTPGCVYEVIEVDRECAQGRPYILLMLGDNFCQHWGRACVFKLNKENKNRGRG